jgi:hypothetical protein
MSSELFFSNLLLAATDQIVLTTPLEFLRDLMKITLAQSLEWFGVLTAIVYSLLVASNTGLEFLGFALLLISAFSIGLWAYLGGHRGILLLQFFYATAGIIGMLRWF